MDTLPKQPSKTLDDFEKEAMKYESILEYQRDKYLKSLKSGNPDKEALSRAIRASKQANKNWSKILLFTVGETIQ